MSNKIKTFFQNNYWFIVVILIFFIFLGLLYWNSFTSPWEGDEGEYAYSAWLMRQGIVPYQNSFFQKPPLILYTYYLSHSLSPFSVWLPRFFAFLFSLATSFLLALTAKKLYGQRAGWLALWFSTLLFATASFDALPANTEKFMILPLAGLIALFVYRQGRENILIYFSAGVLGALAILYKQIVVLPVGFLLIYWLVKKYWRTKDYRLALRSGGIMMAGGVVTAFISLAYLIGHGVFRDFWQETVGFNLSYASGIREYFPGPFLRYARVYLQIFWPSVILLAGSLFFLKKKYFGLWFVLLFLSLLTVITSSIPHYFLLLFPFLSLIVAGSGASLLDRIKIETDGEFWKNLIMTGIIAVIVLVFSMNLGEQFFLKPKEMAKWLWTPDNIWGEALLMAKKIDQYTNPEDKIFIAGSESQIYYFSQRVSASKFNITFAFSIDTPWRESYQEQAIRELKTNRPAAIIVPVGYTGLWDWGKPSILANYLDEEIKANYRLAGSTISEYIGYNYQGPKWLEANKVVVDNNSMLLFIRK